MKREEEVLIKRIINKLFAFAGIYIKQYYAFSKTEKGMILKEHPKNFKRPVLIIGREHCYECSRDLPIARIDEARKAAMMMEDIAPYQSVNFFLIESLNSDSCRIHFFAIEKLLYLELAKHSWLLLPESLLIKQAFTKHLKSNAISAQVVNRQITAYQTNDGFKSIITNDGHLNLDELAQYSAAQLDEPEVLTSQQYAKILIQNVFSLPRYCYQQGINSARFISWLKAQPLKIIAVTASSMFALYLGLSSLWLIYQQNSLHAQIDKQKNELEHVFHLKSEISAEFNKQAKLAKIDNLSLVTANVWPLLFNIIEKNSELLSVNFQDGKYTVRMKVVKSTEILQQLSESTLITNPTMVSPVMKSHGKEIMAIKFSLKIKPDPIKTNLTRENANVG